MNSSTIAASLISIRSGFWEITEDQNTGSNNLRSNFKLLVCEKIKPMIMMEGPMFKFGNAIIYTDYITECNETR